MYWALTRWHFSQNMTFIYLLKPHNKSGMLLLLSPFLDGGIEEQINLFSYPNSWSCQVIEPALYPRLLRSVIYKEHPIS